MLTLDPFQQHAAAAIDRGESVLVSAPTGAGKTLVADHAIDRALTRGQKAFVTTPLKALSNQKFRDLAARLGSERVGLLTGDRSVRPHAPVVVMTTEVLRALLYDRGPILEHLGVVVLDEFHYLQDPDRGPAWEEILIHAPGEVAVVALSATLPGLDVLHRWMVETHGPTALVVEDQRPVQLDFLYAVGNLQGSPPLVLPVFLDGRINPMAENQDGARKTSRGEGRRVRDRSRPVTPPREDLLDHLRRGRMLPAIWFVLSRHGCDRAVADLVSAGVRLTTHDETVEIDSLVQQAMASLDADEVRTLDATGWRLALASGIAAHHGGMAPLQREVVEVAAAAGLVKVVFATETLALGVNLPAKTVVIDRVTRSNASTGGNTLTAAEFAQLAGRAGRRGLDRTGNVVVPWSPEVALHRVAGLAGGRADNLRSYYRATPAMVANLLHAYGPDEGRRRFRRSLAHHLLADDLRDLREMVDDRRTALGDLDDEVASLPRTDERSAADAPSADTEDVIDDLEPGDVIVDPGRSSVGRLLVVAPARRRRGQAAIDTVRADARRVVVTASDFRQAPAIVGRVELDDLDPGTRGFARLAADRLRSVPEVPHPTVSRPAGSSGRGPAAGAKRARLAEEVALLEQRLDHDAGAFEFEFDAVADLLRRRGHLDGWALTDSGAMVRRLFHERGLLVAECMAAGAFEGLEPAELAGLVSAFRSGAGRALAPSPIPTLELRERWRLVERVAADLERSEADAGLPLTPAPDPALVGPVYRWTRGDGLAETLLGTPLGPGDLAREARQVVELLEQIAVVAAASVAAAAEAAVAAISRGVVVASAHRDDPSSVDAGAG